MTTVVHGLSKIPVAFFRQSGAYIVPAQKFARLVPNDQDGIRKTSSEHGILIDGTLMYGAEHYFETDWDTNENVTAEVSGDCVFKFTGGPNPRMEPLIGALRINEPNNVWAGAQSSNPRTLDWNRYKKMNGSGTQDTYSGDNLILPNIMMKDDILTATTDSNEDLELHIKPFVPQPTEFWLPSGTLVDSDIEYIIEEYFISDEQQAVIDALSL